MKSFLFKVLLFFSLLAIIDVGFKVAMDYITRNIEIGGTGRDNFICNSVNDEMLIFGSSKAERHYNAQMITDSLGIQCYNCGEDGCGIILAYGRMKMIKERYTPSAVLYEITPIYDYLAGEDNHKYLGKLKRHYNRSGIDSLFWSIDNTERYKMLSGMYRHNSSFLQNIIVYVSGKSTPTGQRGFRPRNVEMDTLKIRRNYIVYDSKDGYFIDSLKLGYLNRFLDELSDSKIVFVVSPTWYGLDTLVLEPIKDICMIRKIPLLDFSNDISFVHHNEFFDDGTHLNEKGANEFTIKLINRLRLIGF